MCLAFTICVFDLQKHMAKRTMKGHESSIPGRAYRLGQKNKRTEVRLIDCVMKGNCVASRFASKLWRQSLRLTESLFLMHQQQQLMPQPDSLCQALACC